MADRPARTSTLVFTFGHDDAAMGWLGRRRLPLVLVDLAPLPGVASVNVDDRGGARLAARHLLDLGHRRIGIVTVGIAEPYGLQRDVSAASSAPESYTARQRLRGWLEGLDAAGVTPVVVMQPKMPYRPEADGHSALALLLAEDSGITGILCFSDRFAAGVLAAAHDRGLTVPGDLSIVGFDDSPVASNLRPALTTVRQDLAAKGHAAAAGLIAAVRAKGAGGRADPGLEKPVEPGHVVLPTELVVRASTAAPRIDAASG